LIGFSVQESRTGAGLIMITLMLLPLNNVKWNFIRFSFKLSLLHEQKDVINIDSFNGPGAFRIDPDPDQPH
jgi:hypothetical protein